MSGNLHLSLWGDSMTLAPLRRTAGSLHLPWWPPIPSWRNKTRQTAPSPFLTDRTAHFPWVTHLWIIPTEAEFLRTDSFEAPFSICNVVHSQVFTRIFTLSSEMPRDTPEAEAPSIRVSPVWRLFPASPTPSMVWRTQKGSTEEVRAWQLSLCPAPGSQCRHLPALSAAGNNELLKLDSFAHILLIQSCCYVSSVPFYCLVSFHFMKTTIFIHLLVYIGVYRVWPIINKVAMNICVHFCEDIYFHFSWVNT